MTTQADAGKAARIFKETQPAIDALKDTVAANKAARKILDAYMAPKNLTSFCGVGRTVTTSSVFDFPKLLVYLGDKAADFKRLQVRTSFKLLKRAKRSTN